MEKYRQWEDEKNGINPFINAPRLKQQGIVRKILAYPLMLIGAIKVIIFLCLYFIFAILQVLKHGLVIKQAIRSAEIALNKFYCFIFLSLLGVYKISQDPSSKRVGDILTKLNNSKRTIILSSQSNLIDWFNLMYRHSPIFLRIVKSKVSTTEEREDLLVKVSYVDLLLHAAGIKIDTYSTNEEKAKIKGAFNYFDLKQQLDNDKSVPIVIFPEGTKTTREASLCIRSNIMDLIYSAFQEGKCNMFCEISHFKYTYFYPNNSTERLGIKSFLKICSQPSITTLIQTVKINLENFNVESVDKAVLGRYKNKSFYFDSIVQENLTFTEFRNNSVSKTCLDHIEFLSFYEVSANSTQYTQSSKFK